MGRSNKRKYFPNQEASKTGMVQRLLLLARSGPVTAHLSRLLPGSSPSRIQGCPQDDGLGDKESKKREKEA